MLIDLAAPNGYDASPVLADDHTPVGMSRAPKILVFDSGLGGLTVHAEVTALRPDADYLYVADDAAFPYGRWAEPELVARVVAVLGRLVDSFAPDLVVIACNTASSRRVRRAPIAWCWPARTIRCYAISWSSWRRGRSPSSIPLRPSLDAATRCSWPGVFRGKMRTAAQPRPS